MQKLAAANSVYVFRKVHNGAMAQGAMGNGALEQWANGAWSNGQRRIGAIIIPESADTAGMYAKHCFSTSS